MIVTSSTSSRGTRRRGVLSDRPFLVCAIVVPALSASLSLSLSLSHSVCFSLATTRDNEDFIRLRELGKLEREIGARARGCALRATQLPGFWRQPRGDLVCGGEADGGGVLEAHEA